MVDQPVQGRSKSRTTRRATHDRPSWEPVSLPSRASRSKQHVEDHFLDMPTKRSRRSAPLSIRILKITVVTDHSATGFCDTDDTPKTPCQNSVSQLPSMPRRPVGLRDGTGVFRCSLHSVGVSATASISTSASGRASPCTRKTVMAVGWFPQTVCAAANPSVTSSSPFT